MQQLLLFLLLTCPLFLLAQQNTSTQEAKNAQTEALMEQLGYKKVDLNELSKQQSATQPCSTCPMKSKATANPSNAPIINPALEISKLQNQVPALEQTIANMKSDQNADPVMLQKYQTALSNTLQQIDLLKQTQTQSKEAKTKAQ